MLTKEQIEETAKALDNEKSPSDELTRASFIVGAHWAIDEFLKDLWHDASEVPKDKREIIFEYKESDTLVGGYNNTKWYRTMIWQSFVDTWGITRWLYIDDLIPKKGGKP